METTRHRKIDGTIFERIVSRGCLISNGIFSTTARRNVLDVVFRYVFLCLMVFIFIGTSVGIGRVTQYEWKIELALFWVTSWMTLARYLVFQRNRLLLLDYFRLAYDEQYLGHVVFLNSMKRFKKLCFILTPFFVIHYINVAFLPFIKTVVYRDFREISAYTIPYFLTCDSSSSENRNGSAILCWDPKDLVSYVVKNSILTFTFLVMILPFAFNLILFAFVIIHLQASVEMMECRIENIFEKTSDGANGGRVLDRCDNSRKLQDLKEVIECYGKLFKLINKILPLLNFLSSYYLVIFYLLSLIKYLVILTSFNNLITDAGYMVPFVTSTLIFYLGFSTFCHGGQVIKDTDTRIGEALYNTTWYQESMEYRKLMYMFQLLLQRSLQMKSLYAIRITRQMFLIVPYRLYSAISIILPLIKNK